jgi:hypothetical protein
MDIKDGGKWVKGRKEKGNGEERKGDVNTKGKGFRRRILKQN